MVNDACAGFIALLRRFEPLIYELKTKLDQVAGFSQYLPAQATVVKYISIDSSTLYMSNPYPKPNPKRKP